MLVIILCLGWTHTSVSADEISCSEIENIINQFAKGEKDKCTIKNSYRMKSFVNEKETYTLYVLNPYGYAILYDETNSLMEACYSNVEWVAELTNENIYYYGGPGRYYVEKQGTYISLLSEVALDDKSIGIIQQDEMVVHRAEKVNALSENIVSKTSARLSSYYEVNPTYFQNLTEYGTNTNRTCTVLATCILLGYYDRYVNDAFVWNHHRNGKGTNEALHQYLNGKVYGSSTQGGIYIRDALSGINGYFAEKGGIADAYSVYSSQQAAVSMMVNKLQEGYPVIASMGTVYGATRNHTAVIYGIYNTLAGSWTSYTLRMHMGWHSGTAYNDFYASANWFYECGYFE